MGASLTVLMRGEVSFEIWHNLEVFSMSMAISDESKCFFLCTMFLNKFYLLSVGGSCGINFTWLNPISVMIL